MLWPRPVRARGKDLGIRRTDGRDTAGDNRGGRLGRDGKFLRAFGRAGSNSGEFSYPNDVRVNPAGNQFICEFGNSRIALLDAQDQVPEVIGNAGAAPGSFATPWAICFDSRGNLCVADSQNHRVQKLVRRAAK